MITGVVLQGRRRKWARMMDEAGLSQKQRKEKRSY